MMTFKPPCHEHQLEFNTLIYTEGQLWIIKCFLMLLKFTRHRFMDVSPLCQFTPGRFAPWCLCFLTE